jgi:DNA (cytosine-5)-methyltransferase 1
MRNGKHKSKRLPLAIDLFSGCGGLTLGLERAGFKVLAAVEKDSGAASTYRANHPGVLLKETDIQELRAETLRKELKLERGELDLLAGCPPCQGFSVLRTRNGGKRNRDARNTLVGEMLRFVRVFRPKAFMMENVPRLSDRPLFFELCRGLQRLGYRAQFDVKDAAHYGVPQRRRRLILLAGRGFSVPFAKEARYRRTVRQTIGQLKSPQASRDAVHSLPEKVRSERIARLIQDIPKDGGSRTDLPENRQLRCHRATDGFKDIYGRMSWDDVAPTITGGCFNPSKGRFLHPDKNRAITMREAALLQGFPRSYVFDASVGKQALALMIGNALPPEFVRRHAAEVARKLADRE